MLVLSRYKEERVRIGEDVIVCVVDIRGDKVRLGFDAPRDVPVHREEVYESIRAEARRAAAEIGVTDVQRIAASFRRETPACETSLETRLVASLQSLLTITIRPEDVSGARVYDDAVTTLKDVKGL